MDLAGKNALARMTKVLVAVLTLSLILALAIFIFLTRSGLSIIAVTGDSMYPTFEDKDTILLVQEDEVERDQIIIVKKPPYWNDYTLNTTMIKRVVGLPDDLFSYDGRYMKINNEVILDTEEEGYDCEFGVLGETELKKDQYIILGDNKTNSLDSIRIFCDGNQNKMFVREKHIKNNGEVRFIL